MLLVVLFLCVTSTPLLEKARKYYKDVRMFDDTYKVGIWDLEFSEDLYGYQGFGSSQCFSNRSCRSPNIVCDYCDWTDPLVCSGAVRGVGSPCPCGTPLPACEDKYPYNRGFWLPGTNSTEAEIFGGIVTDIPYHPIPPNNCSCIVFRLDVSVGAIEGLLLHYADTWLGPDGGPFILSRYGTATVCPSDVNWGKTYILRLVPSNAKISYAKIKISVEYRPIPPLIQSSSCSVPIDLSTTYQCLKTNTLTRLSPLPGSTYIRVTVDPKERCGVIGFWASSNEHLLSTDPGVSPSNSINALRTHRESSPDGRPWPSMYSYCLLPGEKLYAFVLSTTPTDFFVDAAKEWMLLRPISEFGVVDFYKRFLGAVTAICPGKNYTAHRTTYTVSETMDTGSANLRVVYPSDDIDIFYPPPLFASDPYYDNNNIPVLPLRNNRIVVSLFLNQRLSTRSQPLTWTKPWFQNAYEWLREDEWESCTLSVGGVFSGADGSGLSSVITSKDITSNPPQCDVNLYKAASQKIDDIQQEASNQLSLSDSNGLWFQSDRIASSNDFYFCRKKMESYYTLSPIADTLVFTGECVAPFGTNEFNADPCCVIDPVTLYDGCVPRYRNVSDQYEIKSYTDKINSCPTRQCTELSLVDLVSQLNLDRDPTACSNSIDRPADQSVYWKCINRIWGPEPLTFAGPNCTHDIDCPNSTCNVYSGHCFVDVVNAEVDLLSCIYDGLTQFTRTFVSNELGINPLAPNIKSLWLNAFSDQLPCSDPYTPVGYNVNWVTYSRCFGCDGYVLNTTTLISNLVFSPGPSWPTHGYDCWAPGSSSCNIVHSIFNAATYCGILGCNSMPFKEKGYFPFVSTPNFCSNRTFCGITDDGFFYNDVTDIISFSTCNGSTLCVLANNSRLSTTDAAQCNSIFSCDVDCNGSPCLSESSCASAGSCSDATDYNIGIWARLYSKEVAGCFFTIRYRDQFNPTASICEPPFRNTIMGCSTYNINSSACLSGNFAWGDPGILELINPRWITRAHTKSQCLGYGDFCDNTGNPVPSGVSTYTSIYSFNPECANRKQLFSWTPGRWLPGQARNATTVVSKLSTRFAGPPRRGLNVSTIISNLTKAVNNLLSLKVQSNAFCRGAYKRYLDELICSCISGLNESFCYNDTSNITNIGVACDENGTVSAGDLKLSFSPTSLPPATCDRLSVAVAPISFYRSRTVIPLRTLLVNYEEDGEFAARNQQLGIYGKVITDGYSISFSTTITNVTICIAGDYKDRSGKYPVLDLAKRVLDDLIPLGLNMTSDSCGVLDVLESGRIYYVIQRVRQNYTEVERRVFSSGEIAYISVELSLYCLGLIAVTSKIVYLFFIRVGSGGFPFRLVCVLCLMWTFYLFRIVLFSLLLNQSLLGSVSTKAVNYVLFEFPILLYFAFVTNYLCTWFTSMILLHTLRPDHKRLLSIANFVSVVLNAVIFFLFFLMIILFETIIFTPYSICKGSIVLYDSEQTYALVLSYRIIFSAISIIVGLSLFLVAGAFAHYLSDPSLGLSWIVRARVYGISCVGGLGLIGQAIYFLVITVLQSTPINYVSLSILLVLEIIPALLFIFVEKISKPRSKSSGSRTKASGSGSGSAKSIMSR
jgi:hypothetical protein